jgi:hypothetical protein
MPAYDGDRVRVRVCDHLNPHIRGKVGLVLRWVHDEYYLVAIDGTEYLLKDVEFEVIWSKDPYTPTARRVTG